MNCFEARVSWFIKILEFAKAYPSDANFECKLGAFEKLLKNFIL